MQTLQQRMALVKRELVEGGISKDSKQKFQNYDYRGVDQVLGVISALHVKYGINVKVADIRDFKMEQRVDGKGKPVTHMTALYEWGFVNADDGEDDDYCFSIGEGMDTGDKSSGKMQSYAYKNMMFYRYEIPVQGQTLDDYDPRMDNEDETHEGAVDPHGDMQEQIRKINREISKQDKPQELSPKKDDLLSLSTQLQGWVDGATSRDDLLPPPSEISAFMKTRDELRHILIDGDHKDKDKYIPLLTQAKSIADRLPTDWVGTYAVSPPKVATDVSALMDKAKKKSKK